MRNKRSSMNLLTIVVIIAAIVVTLSACGSAGGTRASSGFDAGTAPSAAPASPGSGAGSQAMASGSTDIGSPADTSAPADAGSPGDTASASGAATPSQQATPYSFELNQPFTGFSPQGDSVALYEQENAYKHVLFEINPGGQSYVIDGNLSQTPVAATVQPGPDGGTSISYSEQANGAASTSVQFTGTLSSGGVMDAEVVVDQMGGTVAERTEYFGNGQGTYDFIAPATIVSAPNLPYAPTGPVSCGFSSAGGVTLTWAPPSGGASEYDVYEFVASQDPPLFDLGQVSAAGMTDNSVVTEQNDASIISYVIYSVGSAGFDSLTGLTVTVDGVMPGSPPMCTLS